MKRDTLFFIIAILIWEAVVGVVYGISIRYNVTNLNLLRITSWVYAFADDSNTFSYYLSNSTASAYVFMIVLLLIAIITVGIKSIL